MAGYSKTGVNTCSICPKNKFSVTGSIECTYCTLTQWAPVGSSACSSKIFNILNPLFLIGCITGCDTCNDNETCNSCSAGYYLDRENLVCIKCSGGTTSIGGSETCF